MGTDVETVAGILTFAVVLAIIAWSLTPPKRRR